MRDYFSDRVLFTEFFKSHFNSLTYLWFSKIVFKHKFLKILQKSVWAFEPIRARGFRYQNLLSVKLKELKCPINLVKSAKLYLLSNSYNRKLKMKNPSFGYAWNRRVNLKPNFRESSSRKSADICLIFLLSKNFFIHFGD